jgi:hypothetical protein
VQIILKADMEQPFNEQSSLLLIESMINKAKNRFSESGTLYLIWGIVIFICSIIQFIAVYFYNYSTIYYVWYLTWLVLIYQAFFLARKKKRERVRTYTDEIVGYVWICFIICLLLLVFLVLYNKAYLLVNPAILVAYAIPTFLSGAILKVRSLFLGGICCWVLAISTVFIPGEFHILLIAVAVMVAWIIPGVYMRKRYLKERSLTL